MPQPTLQALALECASLWSWQYDPQLRLITSNCPDPESIHPLFSAQADQVRALTRAALLPSLILSEKIAWAVAAEYDGAALVRYHVFGPVRLPGQKAEGKAEPDFSDVLPPFSASELSRYAAMLNKAVNGIASAVHMPGSSAPMPQNAPGVLLLARLQDKIRNGDLHFKELFQQVLTDRDSIFSLGVVTIESAKRTALLSLDLCSKAALESGLSEKTVGALQDEYIPQIVATEFGHDIAHLCNLFTYHLVRLVRRAKGISAHSGPVQAACTYIEEHACDKLLLRDLAGRVGYSLDHLAKKFKQEVGESLKDYIMRAKVHRAQLMLTTTDLPIGDITTMLSFCSSSHFTKVFREWTGDTPAAYRQSHSHIA